MLTKYKNKIFQIVKDTGLNVKDFSFEKTIFDDKSEGYKLILIDSYFAFFLEESEESHHKFKYWFKIYEKNFPTSGLIPPGTAYLFFDDIKSGVEKWLKGNVIEYLKDSQESNLWDKINESGINFQTEKNNFEDNQTFSIEEKQQVTLSLNEARLRIQETLILNEPQFKMLSNRLDHLERVLGRIEHKTDYKSLFLGSIVSLLLNMYVGQETGNAILNILINTLSTIPNLPSPPMINLQ